MSKTDISQMSVTEINAIARGRAIASDAANCPLTLTAALMNRVSADARFTDEEAGAIVGQLTVIFAACGEIQKR